MDCFGWLCDIVPVRLATIIGYSLQLIGIVIFCTLTRASSTIIFFAYAIIFGIGVGSLIPTLSMQIVTNFGLQAFPSILGSLYLFKFIGDSMGPSAAAAIFDKTGSYDLIFTIFAVFTGIALFLMAILKKPKNIKEELCIDQRAKQCS